MAKQMSFGKGWIQNYGNIFRRGRGPAFTDFTGSGKSIFVRKLSCVVVGTFKACNFVRLSSRPACPWGCTPTNRLYCRDMT